MIPHMQKPGSIPIMTYDQRIDCSVGYKNAKPLRFLAHKLELFKIKLISIEQTCLSNCSYNSMLITKISHSFVLKLAMVSDSRR